MKAIPRSNARKWTVVVMKNGRKSNRTIVECDYDIGEGDIVSGFACVGARGGLNKKYRYVGTSIGMAITALENTEDLTILEYKEK